MKTEQDYKKELESKDAEIVALKTDIADLSKKTVYGMLQTLRDKGLTALEVINAANNAIEVFEDKEDRLEAERVKAIEAAEDAEEAKFCSTPSRPLSEVDQTRNLFDKGIADDLNSIDKDWS